MLHALLHSLKRIYSAARARWREITGQVPKQPAMRSGCVYVHIDARPKTEADAEHARHTRALIEAHQTGRTLTTAEMDYWADRYNELQVGRLGCTFSTYLNAPYYYEALLHARQTTTHTPQAHE